VSKIRVLALLSSYPTLSQTYKENELRALLPYCDVRILVFSKSDHLYADHLPFTEVSTFEEIRKEVAEFRPDVIHGHYLHTAEDLAKVAEDAGVPFTIRTHSFDILQKPPEFIRLAVAFANRSSCIGVLCYPFLREPLVAAGIEEDKLFDCWPVVDFDRFYDPTPNGEEVLNTGACLPKKNMESFIELASMVPERQFNLFPIGYMTRRLVELNRARGSPVKVFRPVEPDIMPLVYKRHQWLVYSATPDVPTVGWPIACAEAQASGVGVLIQRMRPDIETYIGGAGHVFDRIEEIADIVRGPCPPEMREAGFRQAKRSDVADHIHLLIGIWMRALGSERLRYVDTGEPRALPSPGASGLAESAQPAGVRAAV